MKSKLSFIWVVALIALTTVFNLNFNPAFAADSVLAAPSDGGSSGSDVSVPTIQVSTVGAPDYAGLMEMLRSPEIFEIKMYGAVREAYMGFSVGTMVVPQGGTTYQVGHWDRPQPMSVIIADLRQIVQVKLLDTRERASVWMQLSNAKGQVLFSGGVYNEYLKSHGEGIYSLAQDVVLSPMFYNYWEGDGVSGVEYIPSKDSPKNMFRRSLDRDEDGTFLVPWVLSQQSGTMVFYSSKQGVQPVAFDLRSGQEVPLSVITFDSGHALVSGFHTVHGQGVVNYIVSKDEDGYDIVPKFEWTFGTDDPKRVVDLLVKLPNGSVPYAYYITTTTDDPETGVTVESSNGRLFLESVKAGKSYYIAPLFRPGEVSRPSRYWPSFGGEGKG